MEVECEGRGGYIRKKHGRVRYTSVYIFDIVHKVTNINRLFYDPGFVLRFFHKN